LADLDWFFAGIFALASHPLIFVDWPLKRDFHLG
jgi:hypothetical protein